MAYNLRSLAYSINQALHPVPQLSSVDDLEKEKLESLLVKVTTLQQILEHVPLPTYKRLAKLQRQVIALSHQAEDIVDSAIANRVFVQETGGESSTSTILGSSEKEKSGGTLLQDLQNLIEEFHSLINNDLIIVDSSQQQTVTEKFEDLTIVDSSQQQTVTEKFGDLTLVDSSQQQTLIEKFNDLTIIGSSQQQTVTEKFEDLTITGSSHQQTVIEEFEDLTVVDPTTESSSSVVGRNFGSSCFIFTSNGVAKPLARTRKSVAKPLARTRKRVAKPLARTRKGVDESQACRGLDKDIHKLRGQLTRYGGAHLEVIPIVGMGGIGKTTLAQKLYHDPSIVKHYDCRAWVTISQEYEVATIISTLLSCIIQEKEEEKDDLLDRLHKKLYGRRYLIVLDDIWDTYIWDRLRPFLPENGRSSTIILTTRDHEVAAYANPSSFHNMQLLGPHDSWDLFCVKVFGERECLDPKLEKLGRKIVKHCKGLPLAISVISGLLLDCDNTDLWEHVADDISPTVALDEQFSKILSLSYDHLPHHLRPCLLYIGAFSKGSEIHVSKIKRLWAAEGFLKPIEDKTPEEAAEGYLEDLANRNLLLVLERKSYGKVKSYRMHDLLKDLCIRRADEEDFVVCSEHGHVTKALGRRITTQSWRRVILNNKILTPPSWRGLIVSNKSLEMEIYTQDSCLTNSPRLPDIEFWYPTVSPSPIGIVSELLSTSKLVRVLDAFGIYLFDHFPEEILQLVNIRYLSLNCNLLPPLLSRLWNLETFIFCPWEPRFIDIADFQSGGGIDIPDEIWELRKLKHFKIIGAVGRVELHSALESLQTLSVVLEKRLRLANLIERIPNIKKFGLNLFDDNITEDIDLSSLHNLEKLKIQRLLKSSIRFPCSIAKLTLFWCNMDENMMKVIGELSGLKVLKMQICIWVGSEKEWKTYEAGFLSLRLLELGIFHLEQWTTEGEAHFPVLKHLLIRHCNTLEEIPSCIGDIPTLEIIDIDGSSLSVERSARRIQKEQRDMSNDGLQVRIRDYYGQYWKWEYL